MPNIILPPRLCWLLEQRPSWTPDVQMALPCRMKTAMLVLNELNSRTMMFNRALVTGDFVRVSSFISRRWWKQQINQELISVMDV